MPRLSFFPHAVTIASVKLALHRSILFWSGILVMAFIGWAWRDSRSYDSYVLRGEYVAGNFQNSIAFLAADEDLTKTGGFTSVREPPDRAFPAAFQPPFFLRGGCAVIEAGQDEPRGQQAAVSANMQRRSPAAWTLSIPHWLLLPGFALPWSGLLVWRARRRRMALRADPDGGK